MSAENTSNLKPLDLSNSDNRYIMTPDGKGYLWGWDGKDTITVYFKPESRRSIGENRCYKLSECYELEAQ